MPITAEEVQALGEAFFGTVAGGGTGRDQAAFFVDAAARIYVMQGGEAIGLDAHHALHRQWINERHSFGTFTLTALKAARERVRATGTVYWEAEYRDRPGRPVIKAVVGEDWIVERTPSGDLKFVLYMNTFHHLLPDSAPLQLE
jgi:hypothetical protein